MHNPPLVLIADDSEEFREIICTKLKQSGFWVAEAKDGKQAVERVESLHPDLIVMDIEMPNENGTEAVLDIKRHPEAKDTKIVFFTNLIDPWPALKGKNQELAKELGANQYIHKGEDLEVIVQKIKSILGVTT